MSKTMRDVEAITPAQLRRLTEPEVDELFSIAWEARHALLERRHREMQDVYRAAGARQSRGHWSLTRDEVMAQVASEPYGRAADLKKVVDMTSAEVSRIDSGPLAKLEAEENRRGGWERAYLAVTNSTGHVHKSQNCSTCHKGELPTRLHWMIDFSGKNESEIIKAAGKRACTVCYPNAPVEDRKRETLMFSPDEIAAAEARKQRAEAKIAREETKRAKAILATDGGPLRVHSWTKRAHKKQTPNGVVDVPEQEFFNDLPTLHSALAWLTDQFDSCRGDSVPHRDLDKVADAVALKQGKDRDTVLAEAKKRAARRK